MKKYQKKIRIADSPSHEASKRIYSGHPLFNENELIVYVNSDSLVIKKPYPNFRGQILKVFRTTKPNDFNKIRIVDGKLKDLKGWYPIDESESNDEKIVVYFDRS